MNASGGLSYDRYRTRGSEEWMMRIGAADARPILFLPPLFEEMNRTRAFMASAMRLLAAQGYGCWLPDLPGTGESSSAMEECSWEDWRNAARDAGSHVALASGGKPVGVSIRGGCLLDDAVDGACHWRFAPVEGTSLARDLVRASMLKPEELKGPQLDLAGYRISERLLAELREAALGPVKRLRTVRLESDRGEADQKVEGPALWRRSEPANSAELVSLTTSDLMIWFDQCVAS